MIEFSFSLNAIKINNPQSIPIGILIRVFFNSEIIPLKTPFTTMLTTFSSSNLRLLSYIFFMIIIIKRK